MDKYRSNKTFIYQEMAEHYGTAIIPACVSVPKDKTNAEEIEDWVLKNDSW